MIKHHPKFELIQSFVNGDLPASLSAGIAMHAEMCPKCSQIISQLTEQVAEANFEDSDLDGFMTVGSQTNQQNIEFGSAELSIDDMIDVITASDDTFKVEPDILKTITFIDKPYALPKALNNISMGKTLHMGTLARARIQLNENEIHTSLLQIEPGGGVPQHTHKGFELTLLLDGSFNDEKGEYVKGDFIMLDGAHTHNPISAEGCLCYTVANDALHFTQGINKLLNPIGAFIY